MPAQPALTAATPAIDRVHVVLPSSPPHDEQHIRDGVIWLQNNGVSVVGPMDVGERPLRHLAGPDHERAHRLLTAMSQSPVDAVWCGRGGSGALRTLGAVEALQSWLQTARAGNTPTLHPVSESRCTGDRLTIESDEAARRPLIGLSDATALLLWRAFGSLGAAVHGPVITQLPRLDRASGDALKTWLRHPDDLPILRSDAPPLVPGEADGEIIGGNLSMLAAVAGTSEQAVCSGRILLIEEVAEPAYRIDRMFSQLQRCGTLEGVVGVACGTFTSCPHPALVDEVLAEWAERLGVPWIGPLPVGHGEACRPVGIGVRYRLDGDRGTLRPIETLTQSVVRRRKGPRS